MNPTKEELVELIGMADILEAKLRDLRLDFYASDAKFISLAIKRKLNDMCGEEYLDQLRTYTDK